MKPSIKLYASCLAILLLAACSPIHSAAQTKASSYTPADPNLYETIVRLDSTFFALYNTCDVNLEKYGTYYADSIEFYHDKGGLMNVKQDVIDATKRNICGKVTRELVPGSIEVYPVPNYGAIETGLHRFRNNTDPAGTPSSIGKFTIIWRYRNKEWKITRVISLH